MGFPAFALPGSKTKTETERTISTTIDFLDYVFYNKNAKQGFYPLAEYEKVIKELASSGIKKIYLRVNVCGFTLYLSKVGHIYGTEGGKHWETVKSTWLINTLKKYDPLKETIRLGHKYGLKVWAWENLWDDACMLYTVKNPKLIKLYGKYPLMAPFFRDHHDYYMKLNPRYRETLLKSNKKIQKRIINKIVFRGASCPRPGRLTKDDITIYTSNDNKEYKKYDADFEFKTDRSAHGNNIVVINGLKITAPYVKLFHKKNYGSGSSYTLVLSHRTKSCSVYDEKGKLIPATWGVTLKGGNIPDKPLDFSLKANVAWDASNYQIGFILGKPEIEMPEYFLGVSELSIPAVKKYKLAKFKELTEYDFDGFMLNLRTHGSVPNPKEYGYNQIIRDKYLKKYGKDIWKEDFNRQKWLDLRAESLDEFLPEVKRLTNNRPLYITALKNRQKNDFTRSYYELYGDFPWHYNKWISNGSIDGVSMAGACFPEVFVPEKNAGKKIKICMFYQIRNNPAVKVFKKNIQNWLANGKIDEVELYESLHLTVKKKYLKSIKEILTTVK